MVTTIAAVSLTQQQHQQFFDRISGLEARIATLPTHAEAQQKQIRMAEIVIQQLRANPTNPTASCCFSETIPSTTIGPPVRDESSQELTRDLRDYCSGYRDRSMRSRRMTCLSTAERQTSAPQTWTSSIQNCMRYWPSRQLTR